jgi:hypothetical protein
MVEPQAAIFRQAVAPCLDRLQMFEDEQRVMVKEKYIPLKPKVKDPRTRFFEFNVYVTARHGIHAIRHDGYQLFVQKGTGKSFATCWRGSRP